MTPRVSTIIPAYNAAPWIAAAVESALAQNVAQEILVVDDGSTDATRAIAERFGPPVGVIAKDNGGVSSARNAGLARVRGEFIAFLDADDVWLPGKLEAQLAALQRHPQAGTVITDEAQVTESGQVLRPSFFATLPFHSELPRAEAIAAKPLTWLVQACFLPTSSVLTRADVARRAGRFDESMSIVEDRDYWFRLLLLAPLIIIPQSWLRYLLRDSGLRAAGTPQRLANVERVLECYRTTLERRLPAEGTDPRGLLGDAYMNLAQESWHSNRLTDAARLYRRAAALGRRDLVRWLACETGTAGLVRALRHGLPSLRS